MQSGFGEPLGSKALGDIVKTQMIFRCLSSSLFGGILNFQTTGHLSSPFCSVGPVLFLQTIGTLVRGGEDER